MTRSIEVTCSCGREFNLNKQQVAELEGYIKELRKEENGNKTERQPAAAAAG